MPSRPLLGALVFATALVGCATQSAPRERPATDPKLSLTTYIEEGNIAALVVGTRPTRYRLDRKYIPIEIAVVNKGLASLTITPESFTLVGADGTQYPVAGRNELSSGYGSTDVDRRLADAFRYVNNRFSSYSRQPSNLTPGFDRGVPRDHIVLPRFGYLLDFIYFPRPADPLVDQSLELQLRAPELEQPVFVRFAVEGAKR